MSQTLILWPALAQMALTFLLMGAMARARTGAIRSGAVKIRDVAVSGEAWPDRVKQVSNAFHNQLEMPILFYALAIIALVTKSVDIPLLALAWIYVALRIVHALIHTTSNRVPRRFYVFALSNVALFGMLILIATRLATGGAFAL